MRYSQLQQRSAARDHRTWEFDARKTWGAKLVPRLTMQSSVRFTLTNWAGYLTFVIFAAVILFNAAHVSMMYDDSFNASVAKNVALGLGYASSYDTITPFDTYVTTGPTLLLPTALAIKIFGNTSWIPNVVTAVVTLAMLMLILHFASHRLQISWGVLALSCIPTIALMTHHVDGWNRLRGDILAGELVVLGALILPFGPSSDGQSGNLRRVFIAGLILGLAALTKILALACVAGIAGIFLLSLVVHSNRNYRELGAAVLVLVGSVLIPHVLFEIARMVALHGRDEYLANLRATLVTNAYQEPSITNILLGQFDFAKRFSQIPVALETWSVYVGLARHPVVSLILVLGWIASSTTGLFAATATNRYRLLAVAGAGGGLMALFIFIFVPEFTNRTQLGTVVFSFFVGMATAQWSSAVLARYKSASSQLPCWLLPFLPLTLAAGFSAFWIVSFSKDSRPEWEAQRASVVATSKTILSIRASDPDAMFCGLGWMVPRVLEYALPNAAWFRNCETNSEESASALSTKIYLVREPWARGLLAESSRREFATQCERNVIRKDDNFIISQCPAGVRRPRAIPIF